ncbi:MAG: hypothetical protein DYH13_09855 [Alphaproteobacteria bacterium PRO2]|nr:hypothetical protein [Alphaproteobacteria bacterium PRO2]
MKFRAQTKTSGRLVEIKLDPAAFPLSLDAGQNFNPEIRKANGLPLIILRSKIIPGCTENFSRSLNDGHQADFLGLPEGDYKIQVTLGGDEKNPQMIFSLSREQDTDILFSTIMHRNEFIEAHRQKYMSLQMNNDHHSRKIMTDWRIKYYQSELFLDRLRAEPGFWNFFDEALQSAFLPLDIKMKLAKENQPGAVFASALTPA